MDTFGSCGSPSYVCAFMSVRSFPGLTLFIRLETAEGKSMAIDSSIWIYQFQATMRDKEGRALNNAHVLGFLRRISKLLFYGIKPVFVFDGGAPALKRNTLVCLNTTASCKQSHCDRCRTNVGKRRVVPRLATISWLRSFSLHR